MGVTQYVAFLRAINVAGHARVSMSAVRDAFAAAGCRNVQTYIQSGNVLFESPRAEVAAVLRKLQDLLRVLCGEEPQMFLRTLRQVAQVVDKAPFSDRDSVSGAKLYVAFLARRPRRIPTFPVSSSKEGLEAIAMTDREVFIVSRRKENGFFGFPNNFIEERLGIAATSRNWSTVTKIASLARSSARPVQS